MDHKTICYFAWLKISTVTILTMTIWNISLVPEVCLFLKPAELWGRLTFGSSKQTNDTATVRGVWNSQKDSLITLLCLISLKVTFLLTLLIAFTLEACFFISKKVNSAYFIRHCQVYARSCILKSSENNHTLRIIRNYYYHQELYLIT